MAVFFHWNNSFLKRSFFRVWELHSLKKSRRVFRAAVMGLWEDCGRMTKHYHRGCPVAVLLCDTSVLCSVGRVCYSAFMGCHQQMYRGPLLAYIVCDVVWGWSLLFCTLMPLKRAWSNLHVVLRESPIQAACRNRSPSLASTVELHHEPSERVQSGLWTKSLW